MACVLDNPIHANGGCIFADPSTFLVVSSPVTEIPLGGGGRRSGPNYRPRPKRGYDHGNIDALEETRRARILAEDDDIVGLITAMLTKGLM